MPINNRNEKREKVLIFLIFIPIKKKNLMFLSEDAMIPVQHASV